jgi:hypothetical protein
MHVLSRHGDIGVAHHHVATNQVFNFRPQRQKQTLPFQRIAFSFSKIHKHQSMPDILNANIAIQWTFAAIDRRE